MPYDRILAVYYMGSHWITSLYFSIPSSYSLRKKADASGRQIQTSKQGNSEHVQFIGVGESAGSGVPNVYAIWEMEGYAEPTVEELGGRDGTIKQ